MGLQFFCKEGCTCKKGGGKIKSVGVVHSKFISLTKSFNFVSDNYPSIMTK